MYMSLSNKGNHNIILSRENSNGSLPGDLLNVFSGCCVFQLAYLDYISSDTNPRILSLGSELMKRNFLLAPLPASFCVKILCNSVYFNTAQNFLAGLTYSISHSLLVQFTSQEFSLQYWAKFYFSIINAKPFNFK